MRSRRTITLRSILTGAWEVMLVKEDRFKAFSLQEETSWVVKLLMLNLWESDSNIHLSRDRALQKQKVLHQPTHCRSIRQHNHQRPMHPNHNLQVVEMICASDRAWLFHQEQFQQAVSLHLLSWVMIAVGWIVLILIFKLSLQVLNLKLLTKAMMMKIEDHHNSAIIQTRMQTSNLSKSRLCFLERIHQFWIQRLSFWKIMNLQRLHRKSVE